MAIAPIELVSCNSSTVAAGNEEAAQKICDIVLDILQRNNNLIDNGDL
jgi:hypothetical protein